MDDTSGRIDQPRLPCSLMSHDANSSSQETGSCFRIVEIHRSRWIQRSQVYLDLYSSVSGEFSRLFSTLRSAFRDLTQPFFLCPASILQVFYGLFIPYFNIKQYAILRGMDPNLAQYLLPIINAMGIPSRILPGLVADKVGVLNLMVPFVLISGILNLALWMTSSGDGAIIAYAALYGFFSGSFVSLLPAYIGKLSPPERTGARLGSVYAIVAVANLVSSSSIEKLTNRTDLIGERISKIDFDSRAACISSLQVGTPTGEAFVKTKTIENYRHLIGFTGAIVTCGGILCLVTRIIDVRMMQKNSESSRWQIRKV